MVNESKGRVLIVDDDESFAIYCQRVLDHAGYHTDTSVNLEEMHRLITAVSYDIILLDLNLGQENGLDGLLNIFKAAPFAKVYVLTANASIDHAVEAIRRGASGFFQKGQGFDKILAELASVHQVPILTDQETDKEIVELGIIGRSPAMMDVVDKIKRLRKVDSVVLLLGESGTGKEVVARAIHHLSQRSHARFGAINCGAIPESLLESELFGHKRGAFTDAKNDRKGIFELCSDGTLLLDEIGDMPLGLQMKLLRVLQEHEVTPVGSSMPLKINTRIIAATHRDILQEARAKRFREDLYFRLSIVVIHIPPLRDRPTDIPILVEHFILQLNRRFDREIRLPPTHVMDRLMAYEWPGNVRELQNALERAVVLSANNEISVTDIFAHLVMDHEHRTPTKSEIEAVTVDAETERALAMTLTEAKQAFERRYLAHHLNESGGQITEVAERSGRYRADIYRLLARYGMDRHQYQGRPGHSEVHP